MIVLDIARQQGRRWSDTNTWFGPFTLSRSQGGLGIVLDSGDDDYKGCNLRLIAFGWALIIELPQCVLRPAREWKQFHHKVRTEALGGYWRVYRREIGFSVVDRAAIHVYYGAQTDSWPGTKSTLAQNRASNRFSLAATRPRYRRGPLAGERPDNG